MHRDTTCDGEARASCAAEPACLPILLDLLDSYCAQERLDATSRHDLRVIVEEACANVVAHAYPSGAPGPLTLRIGTACVDGRPAVEVTVEDQGVPFDPLSLPAPVREGPVEDLPIGGLGVHLIRRLSDAQRYRRDHEHGNVLVITKIVGRDPRE